MDIDEIRSKAKRKGLIAGGIWLIVFGLIPLIAWIIYKPDTFFKAITNRDFYGWLAIFFHRCHIVKLFECCDVLLVDELLTVLDEESLRVL